MKKIQITLIFCISFVIQTVQTAQSQVETIGDDLFLYSDKNTGHEKNCGSDNTFVPGVHENLTNPVERSAGSFIWPLDDELNKGHMITNYIDHISGSGMKDYNDGNWTYNSHHGTDIALYDFRQMDQFVRIKAAESGTVVQLDYDNFDRSETGSSGLQANYVRIRHNDGTYAMYNHLMKNSVTVKLGEYVLQGQTIGYVGSSGNSTGVHLHFEPGYYSNGLWVSTDPWQGILNHHASLWEDQHSYAGYYDFRLHDMGVYTRSLVGGNFDNSFDYVKEKIMQPNTISGYEDKIGFWMEYQGNHTGRQVRFEMRKSDGSLFDDTYFYVSDHTNCHWTFWTPDFNPGISVTGDWYVRVLYDNVEKGRCYFNVQLLTSNRPRLYPVAGKCFRKSNLVQRDTLRVRPVRSNMQYDLVNAPAGVSIVNDSILQISSFSQTFREREFKVIASMGGSSVLRDTMTYRLIDTTKNTFPGNGVESLELNAKLEGFWDGNIMNSDTITAIIRGSLYPYYIVDEAKVTLDQNGYALVNFFNIIPGIYYYLVIKHRNSIETWSKTAMKFITNDPISYDFTTSRTKAYGDNLKLRFNEYCIYGGDINQSGTVNLTDVLNVFNDATLFVTGYKSSDVTGNNVTNLEDIVLTHNNSNSFVVRIRP